MNVRLTGRAAREYESLPPALQRRADKQFSFLAANLRHPSLDAKKYDESRGVWQARVTRGYRFYFTIDGDTCTILTLTKHPK
jgi:mRNA interferase RelE/StbE